MKPSAINPNKDIITRAEGEEAIIYNPTTAQILVLNPTGYFIWRLIECSQKTPEDIARDLSVVFDVDLQTAQKDTGVFLSLLKKNGFILP